MPAIISFFRFSCSLTVILGRYVVYSLVGGIAQPGVFDNSVSEATDSSMPLARPGSGGREEAERIVRNKPNDADVSRYEIGVYVDRRAVGFAKRSHL